jgi:hypothetical protein
MRFDHLAPEIERRKMPRRSVKIEATLVYDEGVARQAAVVRNVSGAGARVSAGTADEIPDSLYILVADHQIEPCRVVWRKGDQVGLAFAPDPEAK